MRGQEYTVMNYLVWAAFAAAFLVAVVAIYNSVASQGCKTSIVQIRDLLRDAGKMDVGCVQSRGPVMLCAGTTITKDFVRAQAGMSGGTVILCGARGVQKKGGALYAKDSVKADIAVCRCGDTIKFCANVPSCVLDPCTASCPNG